MKRGSPARLSGAGAKLVQRAAQNELADYHIEGESYKRES
jgi:hypothetical protein